MDSVLLIFICTMLVPGFLYFGKIRVLNDYARWLQLALVGAAALLASIALYIAGVIDRVEAIALCIPVYQLLLFRLFYVAYVSWAKREPKDCSLVFTGGMVADRTFSIIYTLTAIMSPFALIGPMLWGTDLAA